MRKVFRGRPPGALKPRITPGPQRASRKFVSARLQPHSNEYFLLHAVG